MPHGSVGTLTSQALVENLGNLKSNAPMDDDKSVNGTGAACQGRMARGSDSVEEPSNLTFGAEQLIGPAEGVDGTGANSQGGMPCGSVSASTTQDLVENLGNLSSVDEDEDVDKTGAASQGGCPHEDQSTGSAAGDQSGSMVVDGSDNNVDKIFGIGLHSPSSLKTESMQ